MIIFLYGKDTYRAREKLNEIVGHYKKIHKSGLNLKYLDFSQGDSFAGLKDEVRQASMFKEKKLLVIFNSFSNAEFREKFLEKAKDFLKSEDLILFYEEEKANKIDPFFKFLKKYAKCQEFEPLENRGLRNWIKKEFEKHKAEIEPGGLEKLIEYVGNDLWRLSNEIKKLASFRGKGKVMPEDVEILVRSKIETDIFRTIDALAEKNKKLALELLHKHLEKGDSPLYLLKMINYQFRNLLVVKELVEKQKTYGNILKKAGLHPFVFRKTFFQSQRFDFGELKKIYRKIFQADLNIKTGRIQPGTALDLLIAEI